VKTLAAKANQVQVMGADAGSGDRCWAGQVSNPMLPAGAAAAYARRIRGGRSGPSTKTLAAMGADNTMTSRAGSMGGGKTAALGNASPAQQEAQALHFW